MKKKKSGEKELKTYGSMSLDVKDNKEDCCEEQTHVSYVNLSPLSSPSRKRQIFTIYTIYTTLSLFTITYTRLSTINPWQR